MSDKQLKILCYFLFKLWKTDNELLAEYFGFEGIYAEAEKVAKQIGEKNE